jgi:hypothetical protein
MFKPRYFTPRIDQCPWLQGVVDYRSVGNQQAALQYPDPSGYVPHKHMSQRAC